MLPASRPLVIHRISFIRRGVPLAHQLNTYLGNGQAVLEVGVLALDVTSDGVRLRVADTGDLEGDVGGGEGLNLERSAVDGVVLLEKVGGGLAEVLHGVSRLHTWPNMSDQMSWSITVRFERDCRRDGDRDGTRTFQEGGTGWGIVTVRYKHNEQGEC